MMFLRKTCQFSGAKIDQLKKREISPKLEDFFMKFKDLGFFLLFNPYKGKESYEPLNMGSLSKRLFSWFSMVITEIKYMHFESKHFCNCEYK